MTTHEHVVWPVRIETGRFVTAPEGSQADLASQVALTLSTRPGDRAVVPQFGLPDQTGRRAVDVKTIEGTVDVWVPAARQAGVSGTIDADGIAHITVAVP